MASANPARTVAGRYRIVRLLGRGGMSEVWLAEDERLGRQVALKFLQGGADLTGDFERETGILSGLRHPNIVTVYDAGEDDGRRYLVMECVEGVSLRDRLIADGPLAPAEAARIGAGVAAALTYAHARGVLHNDVKPENILLEEGGGVRLTDFGAATVTGATLDPEGAAQVMGTIAYVAPEVLQGAPPAPASDVYALSTTLFEALAGRLPYEGPSNAAIAGQKVNQPAAELARFAPGVPPIFESLVNRGLALDPQRRPTAETYAETLAAGGTPGTGPVAAVTAPGLPARHPTRRLGAVGPSGRGRGRRGLLVLAGVLGAGFVVAGAMALRDEGGQSGDQEDDPGAQTGLGLTTPEPTAIPTSTPTEAQSNADRQEGEGNDDRDDKDREGEGGGNGTEGGGNGNEGNQGNGDRDKKDEEKDRD